VCAFTTIYENQAVSLRCKGSEWAGPAIVAAAASSNSRRRFASASVQGLTLVLFSAQRQHLRGDKPSLRFGKGRSERPHMIGRVRTGIPSPNHMRAFRPSSSESRDLVKSSWES